MSVPATTSARSRSDRAGLLLHPGIEIEADVDASVEIEGHALRFATVDLTLNHAALKERLLDLVSGPCPTLA